MGPFVAGLTTSFSNPYWFLWWATFGLSWLLISMERGVAGVLSFYTGHIMADVLWYFLVAFLIVTGKRFLSDRVYSYIIIVCGGFLVVLGGRFIGAGLAQFL
jgi:threonine/homoserine/homoserine lactone efflux protein